MKTKKYTKLRESATDDARMRIVLRKLFPKCAWVSDLRAVRLFFTALLCGRFEERLKVARERATLPSLTALERRRELMFLENLSAKELIDGCPMTLWQAYETARDAVWRNSPPIDAMAEKNVAALDRRVAQYLYVIRNARTAI